MVESSEVDNDELDDSDDEVDGSNHEWFGGLSWKQICGSLIRKGTLSARHMTKKS